jgi:hypothetical protein
MDTLLIVLTVVTLGIGLLAYDELAREGKFLDGVIAKLRSASGIRRHH